MKATWTKLDNGKSFLVLVFGHVSAEVVDLGPDPAGVDIVGGAPNRTWGILTHPFVPKTIVGTLAQAQSTAEDILRGILTPALNALG